MLFCILNEIGLVYLLYFVLDNSCFYVKYTATWIFEGPEIFWMHCDAVIIFFTDIAWAAPIDEVTISRDPKTHGAQLILCSREKFRNVETPP